ncbi:DUF6509 family protein [Cohnella hashimotonis]|uniref:DUF6509 family protein n=1 Tax=Cohnella hashimotonis TaxID=2826895 RepID=A0ABT6TVW6_9BACL|nr:DUF6509 family protein [Cohnella hashimotonis]MDI4649962.1 DUF6509 family protein [Cohnella hashimotonis]
MNITAYSVELVKDPFGILSGRRYEFKLEVEVEEEDELYSEQGVYARIVYKVEDGTSDILTCDWMEKTTNRYLALDAEPEELAELAAFCASHLPEDE